MPAPVPSGSASGFAKVEPPAYLRRKNFVPRKSEDFGDGGAFPEIHVAQYPLEMGRADAKRGAKTLAVTTGHDGSASYDAVVKQGKAHAVVHTGHLALVPKVERMSKEVRSAWGEGLLLEKRAASRLSRVRS